MYFYINIIITSNKYKNKSIINADSNQDINWKTTNDTGILNTSQSLFYIGQVLHDNKLISEYNITEDSNINIFTGNKVISMSSFSTLLGVIASPLCR